MSHKFGALGRICVRMLGGLQQPSGALNCMRMKCVFSILVLLNQLPGVAAGVHGATAELCKPHATTVGMLHFVLACVSPLNSALLSLFHALFVLRIVICLLLLASRSLHIDLDNRLQHRPDWVAVLGHHRRQGVAVQVGERALRLFGVMRAVDPVENGHQPSRIEV